MKRTHQFSEEELSKMSPQRRCYYKNHEKYLKKAEVKNRRKAERLRVNFCQCGCGKKCISKFTIGHTMKVLYSGKNNPACRPEVRKKLSGVKHQNWKGGRRNVKGYFLIWSPKHPYSTKGGYVMEHRLIMEKHIGRYLKQDEVVHHIDENPSNNDIKNLQLMTASEHSRHHLCQRDSFGRFLARS